MRPFVGLGIEFVFQHLSEPQPIFLIYSWCNRMCLCFVKILICSTGLWVFLYLYADFFFVLCKFNRANIYLNFSWLSEDVLRLVFKKINFFRLAIKFLFFFWMIKNVSGCVFLCWLILDVPLSWGRSLWCFITDHANSDNQMNESYITLFSEGTTSI